MMTEGTGIRAVTQQRRAKISPAKRIVAALCATVITTAFAATRATEVGAEAAPAVRMIGRLRLPSGWDPTDSPVMLQIDSARRRIVSLYRSARTNTEHLLEYDLRARVPEISRDADLGPSFIRNVPSPYMNVLDTKRDRLLMLVAPSFVGSSVINVDLKTLKTLQSWDLWERIPGFVGWGMSYSETDDLVYVAGEMVASYSSQNGFLFPGGSKPPLGGVLMALHPENGSMAWAIPLPHCQPLNTWSIGTLVARSRHYRALYVPCSRNLAYPNMAGVQRISIEPGATQGQAMNFRQEFFPISGVWIQNGTVRGVAAFDPPSDRLLVQSLSLSTPGGWVFDGLISGWVGFVPSPGPSDVIGINEGTGHFYAATADLPTLVSSIRATPVPQGQVFDNVRPGSSGTFIHTDSETNRFFFNLPLKKGSNVLTYAVFEDHTDDEVPLPPANYDALTEDIEDGPSAIATYAGGIRGFGSRLSVVGGGGGIWEGVRQMLGGVVLPAWPINVSPGDRALVFGSVPSIDLRNAGAAASAQAVAPDTNTDDEVRTKQAQANGINPALEPVTAHIAWPWAPLACLDGGGQTIEQESTAAAGLGESKILCDLESATATARATSPGFTVALPSAKLTIGVSTSEARAVKSPQGMVSEITSILRGLEIAAPGTGTLSIGKAVSVAKGVAHGRPGTADVSLDRTLERMVLRDAQGNVIRSINECDVDDGSCKTALDAANTLMAPRFRLYVPGAETRKTPKGAYAGVRKADAEYLNALNTQNDNSRIVPAIELIAYNDTAEKSRLVVQGAGIQIDSIYYLKTREDTSGQTTIIEKTVEVPIEKVVVQTVESQPRVVTRVVRRPSGIPAALGGALVVMVRSPKEALHLAVIWTMFFAAIAVMMRRRALRRSTDG